MESSDRVKMLAKTSGESGIREPMRTETALADAGQVEAPDQVKMLAKTGAWSGFREPRQTDAGPGVASADATAPKVWIARSAEWLGRAA